MVIAPSDILLIMGLALVFMALASEYRRNRRERR